MKGNIVCCGTDEFLSSSVKEKEVIFSDENKEKQDKELARGVPAAAARMAAAVHAGARPGRVEAIDERIDIERYSDFSSK